MKRRSFLGRVFGTIALAQLIAIGPMRGPKAADALSDSTIFFYETRIKEEGSFCFNAQMLKIDRSKVAERIAELKIDSLESLWNMMGSHGSQRTHRHIYLNDGIQEAGFDYIRWQFVAEDVTSYPHPDREELSSEWHRYCVKRFGYVA